MEDKELTLDEVIAALVELRKTLPGETPVLVTTFWHEDPQPARQVHHEVDADPHPSDCVWING